MAFGITREELNDWKRCVSLGDIAFLTHYWEDERFPHCTTVTKVGCADVAKLKQWGARYGLREEWIDYHESYPHFDLFGETQVRILRAEEINDQLNRFHL